MRRGAQLILEEKTADSSEPLDKLQPICCNLLIFLSALRGQWIVHVPGRRKSSAWPDTAESSSWRWPPCPPQTLPAESGSTYETWKTGWVKVKSEWIIWPVLEQDLPHPFSQQASSSSLVRANTTIQLCCCCCCSYKASALRTVRLLHPTTIKIMRATPLLLRKQIRSHHRWGGETLWVACQVATEVPGWLSVFWVTYLCKLPRIGVPTPVV